MIKLNSISQDDIGISHPSVQQNTPEPEQTLVSAPVLHALLEPLTFPNGDLLTCIRRATVESMHHNRNYTVCLYYDSPNNSAHWTYMPWDQDQNLDLIDYFAPILVPPNRPLKNIERYLHFYTMPYNVQYTTRAHFDHVEHIIAIIEDYYKTCETEYEVDTAFMREIMNKLYREDLIQEPGP